MKIQIFTWRSEPQNEIYLQAMWVRGFRGLGSRFGLKGVQGILGNCHFEMDAVACRGGGGLN